MVMVMKLIQLLLIRICFYRYATWPGALCQVGSHGRYATSVLMAGMPHVFSCPVCHMCSHARYATYVPMPVCHVGSHDTRRS